MDTEQLEDIEQLARRAVACPKWRWMPGMVVQGLATHWDFPHRPYRFDPLVHRPKATCWPDLSDPATLGCLLALVREAWGKPDLHTRPEGCRWRMWSFEWPSSMLHSTEAEALVAALEAAP